MCHISRKKSGTTPGGMKTISFQQVRSAPKTSPVVYKRLLLKNIHTLITRIFVYIPWTTRLHIPPIHITSLLSPSTLFFAHPIVFCTSYCFLHILLFCTFIAHYLFLFFFLPYICSCVVLLLYNSYFLFFCTVHWADLIWLNFTSSYTLYNLLCDK